MSAQDKLLQQILSQGTTSKWSGGYGTDSAARDMARILSEIGITDLKQFGELPKYEDAVVKHEARGRDVHPTGDGRYVYNTTEINNDGSEYSVPHFVDPKEVKTSYGRMVAGGADDYGNMNYYFQEAGPREKAVVKDGKPLLEVGTTYGNKVTGQAVPSTYGERQTGNAWGGTFEGSGNTGYRVEFGPDGTPYFYTTGASSSEAKEYAPLLAFAALAFGAPMLGELFAGAGAGAAGATELGALSALDAGMGVYGTSGFGAGVGGLTAAELAQLDLALGGSGGSAGAAELSSALASGAPTATNTALTGGSGLSGLDAGMDVYPSTGNIGSPSSIKLSDAKRALDVANKLTGGNAPAGSAKTAGTAGTNTAETTLSNLLQQQASNAALLNILGSKPELANIKSYKELFGEGLFGDSYVPPSAGGEQAVIGQYADSGTASQNEDEQQLFTGGRVDDFDVDALLQILRS